MTWNKLRIEMDYSSRAMFSSVKGGLIEELERLDTNMDIVDSYKETRRPFLLREIAEINEELGLPKDDGVEKWTSKE